MVLTIFKKISNFKMNFLFMKGNGKKKYWNMTWKMVNFEIELDRV